MCEPISASTLAYASLAATAASTVVGFMGAQQQAKAQSQAANYQAAVARNNAIIANQNAEAERQKGIAQEQAQRLKTRNLIGAQRAALASSGVQLDSGSALDIQSSSASLGELDALTIRNNAERNAFGYKTQGVNFQAQAALDSSQAQWARSTGQMSGFSSILGGASSFGDKWLKYKDAGVF